MVSSECDLKFWKGYSIMHSVKTRILYIKTANLTDWWLQKWLAYLLME